MKLLVLTHASQFLFSRMGPSSRHQDILVLPYFHRVSDKMISKWVNLKGELKSYLVGIKIIYRVLFCLPAFLNTAMK